MKKINLLNFNSNAISNRKQGRILAGAAPSCDCAGGPTTEHQSVKQNGNTYRACFCETQGEPFRSNVLVMATN